MKTGLDCDYDKRNISLIICDIYSVMVNQVYGGERKSFEVMTSTDDSNTELCFHAVIHILQTQYLILHFYCKIFEVQHCITTD